MGNSEKLTDSSNLLPKITWLSVLRCIFGTDLPPPFLWELIVSQIFNQRVSFFGVGFPKRSSLMLAELAITSPWNVQSTIVGQLVNHTECFASLGLLHQIVLHWGCHAQLKSCIFGGFPGQNYFLKVELVLCSRNSYSYHWLPAHSIACPDVAMGFSLSKTSYFWKSVKHIKKVQCGLL